MRALLALAAVALLLAGCASDSTTSSSSSASTTRATTSTSPTTGTTTSATTTTGTTGPGPANHPPTGSLTATVSGLRANFTLAGSDPDGDSLTWTLAFGDGNQTTGAALPATASHTYTRAGNFSAAFTISDGKATTQYNVTARVSASTSPPAPSVVVTGSTQQPGNPTTSLLLGANGCAGFNADMNGVDCVFGDIPAGLDGHAFTFTSDAAAPDYELWDACDPVDGVPVQEFGGPATGTLPAGVGCVIMWNYGDGTGAFTFTVA